MLCLTLSMVLLSACGGKESSSNSNPSSASGNSSQDSNASEGDAPSEVLADTAWSIDGTTYFFYADGTLEVSDGSDSVFGTYEWDGVSGMVTLVDTSELQRKRRGNDRRLYE